MSTTDKLQDLKNNVAMHSSGITANQSNASYSASSQQVGYPVAQQTGSASVDDTQQPVRTEEDVNRELGIYIPDGVLTESLADWKALLTLLRSVYIDDLITKEDAQEVFKSFFNVPDDKKKEVLNQMSDFLHQSEPRITMIQAAWDMQEMQEDFENMIAGLTPEEQDRARYFMETGEDIGDIQELLRTKAALEEEEIQLRLQKVFDGRSGGLRVDNNDARAGYQLRTPRGGVVLNEDEFEQRFAPTVEYDEMSEQQDLQQGVDSPTIQRPLSPQQPLIQPSVPSGRRFDSQDMPQQQITPQSNNQSSTQYGVAPQQPVQSSAGYSNDRIVLPPRTTKPIAGLDDLLNNNKPSS